MYTNSREIIFTKSQVIGDTPIVSEQPLCLDISKNSVLLELKTCGDFEWAEDDYFIIDMEFGATSRTFFDFEFYIGETKRVTLSYTMIPNHRVKIAASMRDLKSDAWFLYPRPGCLKTRNNGIATPISKIDRILLRTKKVRDGGHLTIHNAYVSKTLPDFTVKGEIVVDRFGQCAPAEFEGKIHCEKELVDYLWKEYEKAVHSDGYQNPDWNQFGGYKKLTFDKTGYFHTHFDGKRWWLVDPEGCAFLSNGICYGTRMGVHGFIDGMETLFEWIPQQADAQYKDAWTTADNIPEFVKRNGEEAGKNRKMFNFARANMIRAFGNEWWDKWVAINGARIKEWGFNTISVCVNNYFDEHVYEYLKQVKIPYTWTLKNFPKTKKMIFRDFPDVFSPDYKELCEEFAKQLEPLSDDPYMIGYFINNEPEWLTARDVNVAERLLVSNEDLYSKRELIRFLKEKHGTVEHFNKAWGFSISDFDELFIPIDEERLKTPEIMQELEEFKDILVSVYNKIPSDAVKAYAPNNMCLGMRYAKLKEEDFAGTEFYDAFSFNCYQKQPEEMLAIANKGSEKPFMIGEWQYGSSSTPYLCSAIITCSSEEMRGKACSNYIKKAFSNYQLLGAHYFEYNDQPILGRFDGEAYPHGLITITNRPYDTCLKYFVNANYKLYDIALGIDDVELFDVEFLDRF